MKELKKDRITLRLFPIPGLIGGFLLVLFLLSSCLPQAEPTPFPTLTPIPPSETPTSTIVWFPPTETVTPYPTLELLPTENMRPGVAEMIYQDDFSNPDAWELLTSDAGSIAIGLDELTIVINAKNTYLFSVREDWVILDFYLELTASPSMCRDLDEYGILFRISPNYDFYRFSLSCNGQVRLDRIYKGNASSPQPWMLSGAVPPGAPSTSRLGIWAYGNELRFFVNDRYQFTVNDPLLTAGGIGVFVRSTIDWPVTLNFSRLEIYSLELNGE